MREEEEACKCKGTCMDRGGGMEKTGGEEAGIVHSEREKDTLHFVSLETFPTG